MKYCSLSVALPSSLLAAFVAVPMVGAQNTVLEQAKLVAVDAESADFLGTDADISGDTLVVGAPYDGDNVGSVHVFVRDGSGWRQEAKLIASDGERFDRFGGSVRISGDTLVAGAPLRGIVGDGGAAYVFTRVAGVWSEQAILEASTGTSEFYGQSVAIAGDTIAVGASVVGPGLPRRGAVFVYTRSGSGWGQQTLLIPDDAVYPRSYALGALALSGDRLAVGASGQLGSSVDVYARTGTTWDLEDILAASDGETADGFGGKIDFDDPRILVAAWNDDHSGLVDAGSAYVFARQGSTWSEEAKLIAPVPAAVDRFGLEAALAGDVVLMTRPGNGDGQADVHLFARSGSSWSARARLVASDAADGDHFGSALALEGASAVVGAFRDDHAGGTDAGSAYVYCIQPALSTLRNAGSNPAGLVATAPVLGQDVLIGVVSPSHTTAIVRAYAAPGSLSLPGGQTLLVDPLSPLVYQSVLALPFGSARFRIPRDPALCGRTAHLQALLFGGPGSFVLTNAVDLTGGVY